MTSKITKEVYQKPSLFVLHSAAGVCSGAVTRFISQPFDVIKIRFQVIYLNV